MLVVDESIKGSGRIVISRIALTGETLWSYQPEPTLRKSIDESWQATARGELLFQINDKLELVGVDARTGRRRFRQRL